jgi:hypothetical protein
MIPAIASPIPEIVAMSGRSPPGFCFFLSGFRDPSIGVGLAAAVVAMRSIVDRFAIVDGRRVGVEHVPPELHDTLHYFIGAFPYPQNLTGSQRDYGVRRHIDVLDQI